MKAYAARRGGMDWCLATIVAGALTAWIGWNAWVSEDAFITLRYVSNLLEGHGAVFNVGERVQGYTHPLWFGLVALGGLFGADLIYVVTALSLACTLSMLLVLVIALMDAAQSTGLGLVYSLLAVLACAANGAWVSFQTGGLENALSHLLLTITLMLLAPGRPVRPVALTLGLCLLCLSRPDLAILCAPVAAWLLLEGRSWRRLAQMAAAVTPGIAWVVFAALYYGSPIPNSAKAKLGIFPNTLDAVRQGVVYAWDFAIHYPLSVGVAMLVFLIGLGRDRSPRSLCCAAGIIAYLLWIIVIGGDFMRGRMLLPVFTGALVFGVLRLPESLAPLRRSPLVLIACGAVGAALIASHLVAPASRAQISAHGIADEQRFYPGYHLRHYAKTKRIESPFFDLRMADVFREYARVCGAVTIHDRNPGTLGYLAGPDVSIIDTLGLTDAFIASLPRSYQVASHPRPGHPDKLIPLSYLAERNDIMIVPGWDEQVESHDPALLALPRLFRDSTHLVRLPDHLGTPKIVAPTEPAPLDR